MMYLYCETVEREILTPRAFKTVNEVKKQLREAIYRVSRIKYNIGPYEEPKDTSASTSSVSLDETLHNMQELGVDLKIVDK